MPVLAGISSIEHGFYLTDEIIELMLKKDVFMVPTLSAVHHIIENGLEGGIPEYGVRKAEEAQAAHTASFQKAYRAGVKIAMGRMLPRLSTTRSERDRTGTYGQSGYEPYRRIRRGYPNGCRASRLGRPDGPG